MGAEINTKTKTMPNKYMKRAAEIIGSATGDYITEVMPTASGIASEARKAGAELASTLSSTTQSVMPKIRQLKAQMGFKQISAWFMGQSDDLDSDVDVNLNFDTEVDPDVDASVGAEMTMFNQGTTKVAKAVVESSQRLAESQVMATANMVTSIDKQTAEIRAGFKQTNSLLEELLKVVAKNTAALIETNTAVVVAQQQDDHSSNMLKSGKFDASAYRKLVGSNLKNSELGMGISMIGSLIENPDMIKEMLTPEGLAKAGLSFVIDKKSPNFRRNLKSLDDAINETIMSSLLRIGEKRGGDLRGIAGRIFGLDARRSAADTSKAELALKSTPYDTISKEALTNAIPGYLRQLVILNGGPDMTYDYRSRSFKTKAAIRKEFADNNASTGTFSGASKELQGSINNTQFNQMMYDLMMNNLGANQYNSNHRKQIEAMRDNLDAAKEYARSLIGDDYGKSAIKAAEMYAEQLHKGLNRSDFAATALGNQVATTTHTRNLRAQEYANKARDYNVDLSDLEDSVELDRETIMSQYGLKAQKKTKNKASASVNASGGPGSKLGSGLGYTNKALYEIYRRLDNGINVYQMKEPPKPLKPKLPPPDGYRVSDTTSKKESGSVDIVTEALKHPTSDEDNPLLNNEQQDGTQENLSGGERFSRWGSKRGGQLVKALFNGSPEDVRKVFADSVSDIGGLFKKQTEDELGKANKSFGDIAGMVRHKITGDGYTYQDGDETVHVKPNKGVVGFIGDELELMFDNAKKSAGNWLKDVIGYFDYGDEEDGDKSIVDGRKKILGASVGAFAGAGLLGGPIGLLVGGLGGAALSGSGVGKKLQNFLFGHEKDTGKPTGLLARAADAVMSPIEYQVSKTVAVAGGMLKKNVLGPMADIGLAMKDRITTRIDSIFAPITDKMKEIGGNMAKTVGKGIATLATNLFGAKSKIGSTIVGKAVRGAFGLVTGGIGISEIFLGNKIGSRAFHKLSKGETYPLFVGQTYYDPKDVQEDDKGNRSHKHTLMPGNPRVGRLVNYPGPMGAPQFGVELDGDNPDEWRPATKDYLKWRREARKTKVNGDLKSMGFKGRGGYKKWREEKWERGEARRERFAAATAEVRMTPEEIAEEQKKQSEREHEETQASLDQITGEIIPGHSFKTHDQGIHDRLDVIIEHLTGKPFGASGKPSNPKGEGKADLGVGADEGYANMAAGALVNIASNGSGVTDEEGRLVKQGFSEAEKPQSRSGVMTRAVSEMLDRRDDADSEEKDKEKEEEEGFFSKLINTVLDHPALIGIAAAIPLLMNLLNGFDLEGLGNIITGAGDIIQWGTNTIGTIWDSVKKLLGLKDSDQDATTLGANIKLAKYDVALEKKTDLGALGTLKHVQTDGAGNYVTNSTATQLKNNVTWGADLRQGITSMLGWGQLKAEHNLNKAVQWDTRAAELNESGNPISKFLAKRAQKRSDNYLEKAEAAQQQGQPANVAGTFLNNVARSYGRAAVMDLAGKGAGGLASIGAKAFGASDETAEVVGNVTNAGVSGTLAANMATTAIHNGLHPNNMKKSWVDKILDGVIKMIKFLAEKVGADKVVAKVATSKPVETIEAICTKVSSSLRSKIDDVVISKLEAGLAKLGVTNTAAVATAGLAVGAGAIAGGVDGWCKTNHLFGVLPGDEDGIMRAISTAMGAALGAFSFTPAGFVCIIMDTIDAILTAIPVIGKGLTQIVAQWIYSKCAGAYKLAEKQGSFANEQKWYNDTFGTNMNNATFNDMVNNSGVMSRLWEGKSTMNGDTGHLNVDEAGVVLKEGGLKNVFVGNRNKYVHDEAGNLVKNEDGKAVIAVDQYGNKLKENEKFGDTVAKGWGNVVRFFAGGKKYKTGDDGVALVDENGKYVEDESEKNILGKAGDAWNSAKKAVGDAVDTASKAVNEGWENLKQGGAELVKGAADLLDKWNPFNKKGKKEEDDEDEPVKDKDGADIVDSKGKKVTRKNLSKFASDAVSGITSKISGILNGVSSALGKTDENAELVDENGKPIEDPDSTSRKKVKTSELGRHLVSGIGKFTKALTNPLAVMTEGLEEWEKKEAPWKANGSTKDGKKSVKDWIGKTMSGFWAKITGNLQGLDEGADVGATGTTTTRTTRTRRYTPALSLTSLRGMGGPITPEDLTADGYRNEQFGNTNQTTTTGITGGSPLNKPTTISGGRGGGGDYGWRWNHSEFHSGVDLVPTSGSGDTQVGAVYSGTITAMDDSVPDSVTGINANLSASNGGAGNFFKYVTDDGYTIKNFHLKHGSIPDNLKVGDRIEPGQMVGIMGTTGRSTGPHLHYQIEHANAPLDESRKYHSVNPADIVLSGDPLNINSNGNDWMSQVFGDNSNTDGSEDGSTSSNSIFDQLTQIGNDALKMIFGDLISGDISGAGAELYDDTSNYFGYTGNIKCVEDFLAMCAKEIGTRDDGNNKVKYNKWYYGKEVNGPDYPWCMAFVQWCYDQAGLQLLVKTAGCGTLLDKYLAEDPSKVVYLRYEGHSNKNGTPKPGDLIIFSFKKVHDHVGIVEKVNGDTYTTIEGNTTDGSGSDWNGGVVARKTRYKKDVCAFLRVVNWDLFKQQVANAASGAGSVAEGAEGMFRYLKSIGYSDEAAAAVVGCWEHESTNRPKRVESDYLNDFKNTFGGNYDMVANDRRKFNAYSERVAKGRSGYFDKRDGKAYAGLGYAQWTGGRARNLLDFAKDKGLRWYDAGTQLAFMNQEMQSSYQGTYRNLMAAKDIETATHTFAYGYEHGGMSNSSYQARLRSAKSIYQRLKGTVPTAGMGGPLTDAQRYNMTERSHKELVKEIDEGQNDRFKDVNSGVGGPAMTSGHYTPQQNRRRQPRRTAAAYTERPPRAQQVNRPAVGGPVTEPTPTGTFTTSAANNTDAIVNMLYQVIHHLEGINKNTGTSSTLLSEMNDKTVAPQTTTRSRTTTTKNPTGVYRPSNGNNTRLVAAMLRP